MDCFLWSVIGHGFFYQEAEENSGAAAARSSTLKLRSSTAAALQTPGPVLPAVCLVCKSRVKFVGKDGLRRRDPLALIHTVDAGKKLSLRLRLRATVGLHLHIMPMPNGILRFLSEFLFAARKYAKKIAAALQ